MEFHVSGLEYGMLAEGDTGRLTFRGRGICRLSDSFIRKGLAYAGKYSNDLSGAADRCGCLRSADRCGAADTHERRRFAYHMMGFAFGAALMTLASPRMVFCLSCRSSRCFG